MSQETGFKVYSYINLFKKEFRLFEQNVPTTESKKFISAARKPFPLSLFLSDWVDQYSVSGGLLKLVAQGQNWQKGYTTQPTYFSRESLLKENGRQISGGKRIGRRIVAA